MQPAGRPASQSVSQLPRKRMHQQRRLNLLEIICVRMNHIRVVQAVS